MGQFCTIPFFENNFKLNDSHLLYRHYMFINTQFHVHNSKYCIQGQTHLSHRITELHILNVIFSETITGEHLACWFLGNLIRENPHPQDCHVTNWKLIKHRGLRPAHHNVSRVHCSKYREVVTSRCHGSKISGSQQTVVLQIWHEWLALRNKTVTHTFFPKVLTMLNVIIDEIQKFCQHNNVTSRFSWANRKLTFFAFLGSRFVKIFGKILLMRVETLCNTNWQHQVIKN